MLAAPMALAAAALFTGAAAYISLAEHPARMALDDAAALRQWKPAYARAVPMQAGLALLGGLAGLWAAWASGSFLWLAGALLLAANIPYTLILVMPVNHRLEAIAPEEAGPHSRALLDRWGRLHLVRSLLGGVALLCMIAAPAGPDERAPRTVPSTILEAGARA